MTIRTLRGVSALALLVGVPGLQLAQAQETTTPASPQTVATSTTTADQPETDTSDRVVVTGSLIATKPEFSRFYQYMLGFKVVGQPAAYPPGDHKIVLLAGSFSQAELRQSAQNAFFKITADEIASMKAALGGALEIARAPSRAQPVKVVAGR